MERERIKETLLSILYKEYGYEASELSEDTSFGGDLGLDSLNRFNICYEIERKLNILVEDDEMDDNTTIGNLIDLAHKKSRQ